MTMKSPFADTLQHARGDVVGKPAADTVDLLRSAVTVLAGGGGGAGGAGASPAAAKAACRMVTPLGRGQGEQVRSPAGRPSAVAAVRAAKKTTASRPVARPATTHSGTLRRFGSIVSERPRQCGESSGAGRGRK